MGLRYRWLRAIRNPNSWDSYTHTACGAAIKEHNQGLSQDINILQTILTETHFPGPSHFAQRTAA